MWRGGAGVKTVGRLMHVSCRASFLCTFRAEWHVIRAEWYVIRGGELLKLVKRQKAGAVCA